MSARSGRRLEDHAIARAVAHGSIGARGVGQRVDRVRRYRKRTQATAGKSVRNLAQSLSAFDRGHGKRVDTEISVPAAIKFEDIELHYAVDRRN